MTAWVLILYLGSNAGLTVPGIESEQECRLLIERMAKERPWLGIATNANCFPYRASYRF